MVGGARLGRVVFSSGVKEGAAGLTRRAGGSSTSGRSSVTGCCIVRSSSALLHSLAERSRGEQEGSRSLRPPARHLSSPPCGAHCGLGVATAGVGDRSLSRRQQATRGFHSTRPSAKRDFYEVLGVTKGADKSEIKRKYFQLAKKYHPDQNQDNPDAKKKFQEVTEAYEVLSNDEKRAQYDSFGHAGMDPNGAGAGDPFAGFRGFGGGGFQGFQGFQGTMDAEDAQDLFEQLFGRPPRPGQRRRPRGPRRGQDLQLNMELSFLEAAFGVRKDVDVSYSVIDNGKRNFKTRSVTVDVPGGVESGLAMHMPGEGAEGEPGAPRGDLYVSLRVQPDPYFERSGADVHVIAKIGLAQAALGGKVDVLTIDGMVEVTVPKGSQPDAMLLLRGRGLPRLTSAGSRAGRGDQIVRLKVEVPTELSDRQRELLEELRDEEDRLSGKGSRSGGKGSRSDHGSDSEYSKGDGDDEYSERHGTWGQYLQEAFDRLKSHLARKKNASSS